MADEPEIIRFARLVRSMRAAQIQFFKGDKSPALLNTAKDLELRVDKALRWIDQHRSQGDLFEGKDVGDGPYQRRGGR